MDKKNTKIIVSLILLFILTLSIVIVSTLTTVKANTIIHEKQSDIKATDVLQFDSSLYTNTETYQINENKGMLKEDDQLVVTSENKKYSLYFNEKLCIFKIQNHDTGYIYASACDEVLEKSCTNYYAGMVSSSFVIEYYKYNDLSKSYNTNVQSAWINKALALTKAEKEEFGEMDIYPYNITTAPNTKYSHQLISDGVKVTINFANATELRTDKSFNLGIEITAYVTLDNDGLHVNIPTNEIVETDTNLLANVIVMPFLGATYNNETDGYMVIPDGSGALLRYGSFEQSQATQISMLYYGNDEGRVPSLSTGTKILSKNLSAPVFGLINGVKQDGVYGIIESGDSLASILISPNGALNIKYNYLTTRFTKRYHYLLYGVNMTILDKLLEDDITLSYRFLSNEEASYVGMAKDYQSYLVNKGLLNDTSQKQVQMEIDFLLADTTTALIGYKTVTMTKIKTAKKILEELHTAGINNYISVLKGWNNKGFSGSTPNKIKYNTKIGTKAAFNDFVDYVEKGNNQVYFYNDYVNAYSRGNMSYQSDVAKSNQRLKMVIKDNNNIFQERYYLYPESTKEIIKKDLEKYRRIGIPSLALDSIGYTLFSYYNGDNHSRNETRINYEETLNIVGDTNVALYEPNSYMWKYIDSYLNMTTYTTNYTLYSDTVPFIPYVLKGYVDYYSSYVNFSALGNTNMLRMLDYGCYPAYLLTDEMSYNLKYTDSYYLYTTAYQDLKEMLINNYHTYQNGYENILNSIIIDRLVIKPGLIINVYQNKDTKEYTSIIINYLSNEESINDYKVSPLSYLVVKERLYE